MKQTKNRLQKITKKEILEAINRAGFNLVQYVSKYNGRVYLVSNATKLNSYERLVK